MCFLKYNRRLNVKSGFLNFKKVMVIVLGGQIFFSTSRVQCWNIPAKDSLSINPWLGEVDVFGAQSVEYPTKLSKSGQITCPTILALNPLSVSSLFSPPLSVIAWLFLCQLFSPLSTCSGLCCPPLCYSFCSRRNSWWASWQQNSSLSFNGAPW